MYIMWALQYIHDITFVEMAYRLLGAAHKVVPMRIDKENPSYTLTWEQVKLRSMSKQNRR